MNELNFSELELITPTTDPQDPGFDTQINYVSTRDPTVVEPLVYNGYPFLPLGWQTVTTSDLWATYITTAFWLCVNNTPSAMVWWRMVFDANILSVLNTVGWNINTSRNYKASGISLNSSRQPSLMNDTKVVASIKQVNTLLTSTYLTAEVSPDNSTWSTVGSIGVDNGAILSYTTMINFECPAGYYYRMIGSGSGRFTLASCNELAM